jgi:hypothetical protein
MKPADATVVAGPLFLLPAQYSTYMAPITPITGPANFGSGPLATADTGGSGDLVGLTNGGVSLLTPLGYASGNPLNSGPATYVGQTFATLGVTPGVYVWKWGVGADADSFTLQTKVAAAPEPASLALFGVGLAGLGMVLRTRRS